MRVPIGFRHHTGNSAESQSGMWNLSGNVVTPAFVHNFGCAIFRGMNDWLKTFVKQILPHGLCEYSVRRHDFIRHGLNASQASWMSISPRRHRAFCDARLDLLPKEITSSLRTCVDAGAHEGSWTDALLDIFAPERIIAVECEPKLVKALKSKFLRSGRVTVVDAALAAGTGTSTFYQLQHPASSSLLRPRCEIGKEYLRNSWEIIGNVEVRTIGYDELVESEQEISVLKLDIQGAEMEVIRHSNEGLDKTKSVIMEVNFMPHYDRDAVFPELHAVMVQRGFGLYRLSSVYHRGGRALFADAVYVQENILQTITQL